MPAFTIRGVPSVVGKRADEVLLIEEILRADEDVEIADESCVTPAPTPRPNAGRPAVEYPGTMRVFRSSSNCRADGLHVDAHVDPARIRPAHLDRPAMPRHLRQELAHERRVGVELGDHGAVEEVPGLDAQRRRHAVLDVGLHAADLACRPGSGAAASRCAPAVAMRDVRHRIGDAVVVPGQPRGHATTPASTRTPSSPPTSRSGPRFALASVSTVPTRNWRYNSLSVGRAEAGAEAAPHADAARST